MTGAIKGSQLAGKTTERLADHLRLHPRVQRGGHAFARKAFRPAKEEARGWILRALSKRVWPRGLTVLTMPGLNWTFERQLLHNRERAGALKRGKLHSTFISSIESDEAIYRASLKDMPGLVATLVDLPPPDCATRSLRTGLIQGYHRCAFEDYAYVNRAVLDAAWIDFNGPITQQRLDALIELWNKRIRYMLVVTAMRGRSRYVVDDLLSHIEDAEIADYRQYRDTTAMTQIAFVRPNGRKR